MTGTGVNYVFDASQHEPDVGVEAIPAGVYNVTVSKTEIVKTKANDDMFKVHFKVMDGQFVGKTVSATYNLWHKTSAEAVRIGHAQLSALSHVTGVFQLDMNNQGASLINAPLRVSVSNDGKFSNVEYVMDVNGNKAKKGGQPATAAAPVAQPVAQQPAAMGVPPVQPAAPAYTAPAAQPPAMNPAAFAPVAQPVAPPAAAPVAQPAQNWAQQPPVNVAQPAAQPVAQSGAAPWTGAPVAPAQ